MKLRLKGNEGNSMRLRVSRSEMEKLQRGETLTEEVRFGAAAADTFSYELLSEGDAPDVTVAYHVRTVTVTVPSTRMKLWSSESQVGIYQTITLADDAKLELVLEKDFACLDRADADNADTFEHPHAGEAC